MDNEEASKWPKCFVSASMPSNALFLINGGELVGSRADIHSIILYMSVANPGNERCRAITLTTKPLGKLSWTSDRGEIGFIENACSIFGLEVLNKKVQEGSLY